MKITKKLKEIVLLLIAFLGITNSISAQNTKDSAFDIHAGYPPAFTSIKSHILVILYDKDSKTSYSHKQFEKDSKQVAEIFPQCYTGEYDFVTMTKDIEEEDFRTKSMFDTGATKFKVINSAYESTDQYRYVLYYMVTSNNAPAFGIYDRVTDLCYTAWSEDTGSKGNWYIRGFAEKIEKIRAK